MRLIAKPVRMNLKKSPLLLFVLGSFLFLGPAHAQVTSKTQVPKKEGTATGMFPKPGEWPAYRRTGTQEGYSPLRGNITKPQIVWKQFAGAIETLLVVEPGSGKSKLTLPGDEVKLAVASDTITKADFIPTPKSPEEDTSPWNSTYADVLPEYPGKEKLEFESAFGKTMTNGQWAHCIGRLMARKNGEWTTIWETKPLDYLFNSFPLVGDFDGDGKTDIAILPFWKMLLFDARTGVFKDSCRFNDNRSYGFHGVYDFDGDGKSEFLVEADFSKHVDVLGFRDGKLTLFWQRDIEQDIADPQRILTVAPDPVMDIDGDGRPEVIITLYNDTGDNRWHLIFVDAITGKTKVDFPDEKLAAPLDVDGDGVKELLTTVTSGVGMLAKIRVRAVKDHKLQMAWEKDNAGWEIWEPPLPANVKSMATQGRQTAMSRVVGKDTYVVLRESKSPTETAVSLAKWQGSVFNTVTTVSGDNLEGLGIDAAGRLLVRARHRFGESSAMMISNGKVTLQTTKRIGFVPGSVIVTSPDGARTSTIVVQGAVNEQVVFQAPKTESTSVELKYISGRGQGNWWVNTLDLVSTSGVPSFGWSGSAFGAIVADVAGDGHRQVIVADAGASGLARLSAKDLNGKIIWQHEFPRIVGTPAPQNTGGVIFWQAGHFTDPRRQDILATTQRSKMHSEETFLLSGVDGHVIWHRDRQIGKRGVGGNTFAVADYDGDGLDDLGSLWPSILYLMKGNTGEDILAMDAKWKQVYAKQVYFGHAVAGNFLNEGKPAIYFSGQLMTGVIRLDGTLVWFDALDKSPAYMPSFGDFDGDRRADVISWGYEEGTRSYDLASGKLKWTMPNPAGADANLKNPADEVRGTASADLDGDGRDEALVVADNTLYCLGTSKEGSRGEVRWKIKFPTSVGPPTVATLDDSGRVSVLVAGADGFVYCLR